MADPESPEQLPGVDALQFRRAEPMNTTESPAAQSCAACKQLISGTYYQVQNHVICPDCAAKIQAGRQAQRPVPWARFVIFGAGAALAGSILYAIPLALGFQIGIVALAVGWMVGKALRAGSYGTGGRRQQILAVVLTYFAISTSFFPAALFLRAKHSLDGSSAAKKQAAPPIVHDQVTTTRETMSTSKAVASLLVFAIIFPFLELKESPASGLISLFILFIGLQRAWAMTARHEIIVTGPYS
jgi:hypothetical protein